MLATMFYACLGLSISNAIVDLGNTPRTSKDQLSNIVPFLKMGV